MHKCVLFVYYFSLSLPSPFSHSLTHVCIDSVDSLIKLIQSCPTLWTVARQVPLSMGFSRQEYWSGLPCPPPGDLPNSAIESESLTPPALAGRFFTTSTTWRGRIYPTQLDKYRSQEALNKC